MFVCPGLSKHRKAIEKTLEIRIADLSDDLWDQGGVHNSLLTQLLSLSNLRLTIWSSETRKSVSWEFSLAVLL